MNPSSSVEAIGHSMFEALFRTFPVACASDEFYYFPQVQLPEIGDYEKAIVDFSKAIELEPNGAMAYVNRVWAYCAKGQWSLDIEDYNEVIRLKPEDALDYYNRGLAYKVQGKKAAALADFEKCITSSNNPQLVYRVRQRIEALTK